MQNSLLLFLTLALIPPLPGQQPVPPIQGNWTGSFADSATSGNLSITLESHPDGTVSGTYKTSSGGFGTVAGWPDGPALNFTLAQTVQGCAGSYNGTLTLSGDHGSGAYSGADCLGKHEHGVISLARAAGKNNIPGVQSKPQSPIEKQSAKFLAGLPPNTFLWRKADCPYCRYLYQGGVPFEVLVTPDVVVAATMGRRRSLWYGAVIVVDEASQQVDVLRKLMVLRLTKRTPRGQGTTFAKPVSPERLARQRGRRVALAFFSGLAMSAPTYSQSNIYGSATTSGYGGTAQTNYSGMASTYTYGGASEVLAYSNYLRRLKSIRERASWIEAASFKDTSLFHGQSARGMLWFKGDGHAAVAELLARVGGKTFIFGWVNSAHR